MNIQTKIITAITIVAVMAVLTSSAVAYTGIPDGFMFTKNLNIGSNDQDVVYLKIVLANEGCLSGVNNTTYFGVKTGEAVKCFKTKYGIGSGTTLVSTLTNAKLNAIIAGTTGATTITVISPNGGEYWLAGSTRTIIWTSGGSTAITNVDINLYKGGSFIRNIASYTANDGLYTWTIPTGLTAGVDYKIRIVKYGGTTINDESNANFSIVISTTCTPNWTCGWGPCINGYQSQIAVDSNNCGVTTGNNIACTAQARVCTAQPSITVTSPNGGETWQRGTSHNITWTSAGSIITDPVNIYLYKGGVLLQTIATQTADTGTYAWTLPTTLTAGIDYKIRISKYGDATIYDDSNANFSITTVIIQAPAITSLQPTFGLAGTSATITGSGFTPTGNKVKFGNLGSENNPSYSLNSSDGRTLVFTVPSSNYLACWYSTPACLAPVDSIQLGGTYQVSVINANGASNEISFTVTASNSQPLTITSPNGGESWARGTTKNITWTSAGLLGVAYIKIDLYKGGSFLQNIVPQTDNHIDGTQTWLIPISLTAATDYKLRISKYGDASTYDESNSSFSISTTISGIPAGFIFTKTLIIGSVDQDVVYLKIVLASEGCLSDVQNTTYFGAITATGVECFQDKYNIDSNESGTTGPNTRIKLNQLISAPTTVPQSITVISPNGGESLTLGSTYNITWTSAGYTALTYVKIELYKGGSFLQTIVGQIAINHPYSWTISTALTAGADYKLRISDAPNTAIYDESNNNFSIFSPPTFSTCGNTLTYAGKNYATVLIGNQCWFKQNLNISTMITGTGNQGNSCTLIQKYCYNNDENYCNSNNNPNYPDGALYQWDQAMCGSTTPGAQGICPTGWHIPTDDEWCILEQTVDSSISCASIGYRGTDGGIKLRPGGSSGFEGNLAGLRYGGGFFTGRSIGSFWSSTWANTDVAWTRLLLPPPPIIDSNSPKVYRNYENKWIARSVRCLKDSVLIQSLSVVSPNGGETLITGTSHNITWTSGGLGSANIKLDLYKGGNYLQTIVWETYNTGDYSWTIPTTLNTGNDYKLRISKVLATPASTAVYDESNINFTISSSAFSGTCGDTLTYAGKNYATILIGNQCWMKQNLNVGTMIQSAPNYYAGVECSPSSILKYCYNDNESNCNTYGALYPWDQVMCGSGAPGAQGICPDGWHIPTHYEWTKLERAVCTSSTCATDFPYDTATSGSRGTNEGTTFRSSSGFNALLAGDVVPAGFGGLGQNTYFWSSSQGEGVNAWGRSPLIGGTVNRGPYEKSKGFSVRCVKSAPLTVLSPDGGESWARGTSQNVIWTPSGLGTTLVNIDLYKGGSFLQTIASQETDDGLYTWIMPTSLTAGADYKLRISKYGDANIYDDSNANFSITATVVQSLTVIFPNGGESWAKGSSQNITWTSGGLGSASINIDLYKGGSFLQNITSYTANDGFYTWTIPTSLTTSADYKIRIVKYGDVTIYDESNANFSITAATVPQFLTITSPNGGESWARGFARNITWTSGGSTAITNVKIDLYKGGSFFWTIVSQTANSGIYSWTIPATFTADIGYLIKISNVADTAILDYGDNYFSISVPAWTCGDPLVYAGKNYATVLIGYRCWMKQNLNVGAIINGANNQNNTCYSIQKYCYENNESNCDTYGALYQWDQVMATEGCGSSGVQGICPGGWHIPSDYEWIELERAVCASSTCATDFDSAVSGWRGTNEGTTLKSPSGFNATLAGYRNTDGSFNLRDSDSFIWSSSQNSVFVWIRGISSYNALVNRDIFGKTFGLSVRCIKNILSSPSITVLSPNGGESWAKGSTHNIIWTSSELGATSAPVNIDLYEGTIFSQNIARQIANNGSYTWTIATSLDTYPGYKLRISKYGDPTVYDVSNANFSITTAPTIPQSITVTSPNGGEAWSLGTTRNITWTSAGTTAITNVKIELYRGGSYSQTIASNEINDGAYGWTTPINLTTDSFYKIRVSIAGNPAIYDESDNYFALTVPQFLTVTSPNGGETWTTGPSQNITWTSASFATIANVKLDLYKAGSFLQNIASYPANNGSYSWTIPANLTTDIFYKIRVSDAANPAIYDESNNNFSITIPQSITITSPNGGESWVPESIQKSITWTSAGLGSANIKIDLYKGESFSQTIVSQTGNSGAYYWTMPSALTAGSDYKIRISKYGDAAVYDESNNNFNITAVVPPASILNVIKGLIERIQGLFR